MGVVFSRATLINCSVLGVNVGRGVRVGSASTTEPVLLSRPDKLQPIDTAAKIRGNEKIINGCFFGVFIQ